ncbi:MAG TPA: hypothetical protein VMJ10_07730 [Kofleriaceae bacterium]|nr:hypothetical protein [Kofleriaceae bacterium]
MRLASSAVLLAACAQPVVDMTLELPSSTTTVDLSCVTAVDLMPIADGTRPTLDIGYAEFMDTEAAVSCVDLDSTPQSLDDIASQIRGKFEMGMPSGGLAAVVMRGRAGACKDNPAFDEAVFYGAGKYDAGSDSLPVQVKHNLSCDQLESSTVAMIDFGATITSKTCTSVDGGLYEADIRPTLLSGKLPSVLFEEGADFVTTAAGVGTITAYQSSFAGTCPAFGMTDPNNTYTVATCLDPTAATACAKPGQLEGGFLSAQFSGVQLPAQYEAVVFGGVWTNTGTKGPVAGATVTLDANSDAQVVYGSVAQTGFTANASATSTDATGGFVVYTNQVVGITVTATGHTSTHVFVGADPVVPGTSLVVVN